MQHLSSLLNVINQMASPNAYLKIVKRVIKRVIAKMEIFTTRDRLVSNALILFGFRVKPIPI
jgi:hypothetical protein